MKDLVFVDIETTGLVVGFHEIIEVAALRVDPQTLKTKAEACFKAPPQHPERFTDEVRNTNRYSIERWKTARPLGQVLRHVKPILQDGILVGHNVRFDWEFLSLAYQQQGMTPPDIDYHLVDTALLAWPLVVAGVIERPTLRVLCDFFGVDNTGEHSALADVHRTIAVYRRLLPMMDPTVFSHWATLKADERSIVKMILQRVNKGRNDYGPWKVNDRRDYPKEALLEVFDALTYCAAQLIRMQKVL